MTDIARPIGADRLRKLAVQAPTLALNAESAAELCALAAELLQLREDLDGARAETRREQDARANLRVELNRVTACLGRANQNHEEFERRWYLACDELERVKAERDEARADLVKAMQTIEAATIEQPARFALWLNARGWFVGVRGKRDVALADRLGAAMTFDTEAEADAALDRVMDADEFSYAYPSECGAVVTL